MEMISVMPILVVESVKDSIEFYELTLGFEAYYALPNHDDPIMCMVKKNAVTLLLKERSLVKITIPHIKVLPLEGSMICHIQTNDIHTYHNELQDKVTFVQPLTKNNGMIEFSIIDNSGYILNFAQY